MIGTKFRGINNQLYNFALANLSNVLFPEYKKKTLTALRWRVNIPPNNTAYLGMNVGR